MMCVKGDYTVYFNALTQIWDVCYPLYDLVFSRNSGVNLEPIPFKFQNSKIYRDEQKWSIVCVASLNF